MARGLQYSHEQGVNHRDIKKTNILISNSGEAKLVDFGLATIEADDKKSTLNSQRTVDYSALERTCNSPKGDPRSDLYFLGLVFYEMLTGVSALPESESKEMLVKMLKRPFGSIKPISEQRHAPDEALCRIIDKMMKMDLKARYQSMAHVVHDLEQYAASHGSDASRPGSGTLPVTSGDDFNFDFDLDPQSLFVNSPHAAPEPVPQSAPQVSASTPIQSESPPQISAATAEEEPQGTPSAAVADDDPTRAQPRPASQNLKQILCVESQDEIRDAFRKSLPKMGYRPILVGDPERAAERYRESPVDGLIFDLDGFSPAAIRSLAEIQGKAEEEGRSLTALILLGPRQHHLQEQLPTGDSVIVLAKPIKMRELQEALQQLVPTA
jgi:serine/threonine protein kinase